MRNFWTLKLSSIAALLIFCSTNSFGQLEEPFKNNEELYYLFPIKPGVRNTLAGTMGELRSSHFHTGLDIRTEGRIGIPVQSSSDGYISRVAVSTSGYGNALYVTHPNGYTTVYAHLDQFEGPIAEYVKKEQYRRETSELNLYFHKDRFSVKKGEVIALSGNSGSSGGPHLHYDLRDKNNQPVNPLHYGFHEILDNTPPVAQNVAIKTLDKYARVNGQFGRMEFDVRRVGNNYVIDQPIEVYGKVGIELYAYDKLDNSRFRCGITDISLEVGGEKVFSQTIDKLNFGQQRDILVHMDYPELVTSGARYHKLYIDDGNQLPFYTAENKGVIDLSSNCQKPVVIEMVDSYNNKSNLKFNLKCSTPDHKAVSSRAVHGTDFQLIENTLVISTPKQSDQNVLDLFIPEKQSVPASYILNDKTAVYLWDMKNGLPHSFSTTSENVVLSYKDMVPSGSAYAFYSENMDIDFAANSLFDTLYIRTNYSNENNREVFEILNKTEPLRKHVKVTLKPTQAYPDSKKLAVYEIGDNDRLYHQGGSLVDGKIIFYTRSFGRYTIASDSIPPKITPIKTNQQDLMFKISDDLSGINSYQCTLNGKYVLMHYDYKRNLIWSEKYDDEAFEGEIKLTVTDNAENKAEYIINL